MVLYPHIDDFKIKRGRNDFIIGLPCFVKKKTGEVVSKKTITAITNEYLVLDYTTVIELLKIIAVEVTTRFSELSEEKVKNIKKTLGLPVTKKLVYIPLPYLHESVKVKVNDIIIDRLCSFDGMAILNIEYEGGIANINSSFLAEMQKPDFERKIQSGGVFN